jgi:hypothetical protein
MLASDALRAGATLPAWSATLPAWNHNCTPTE